MARRLKYEGRVVLSREPKGRDANGKMQYRERRKLIGRFATKRERDEAVLRAKLAMEQDADREALAQERPGEVITVDEYADSYLESIEATQKASSYDTARSTLKAFRTEFGDRPLASITRLEAERWAASVPPSKVPIVVQLLNRAVGSGIIDRNPFKGLGKRTKGRSEQPPPTEDEFDRLIDACKVLGPYAPVMRAMLRFAAYTGMRPGELFALEWGDIDLTHNRIHVKRRLYRGEVDLPKSNKERTIALPPPARDALLHLPTRAKRYVFTNKSGGQLRQATLSGYWSQVKACAGLDFDWYLATKHYGVHLLYKLGLSQRAIAAQMGWSESAVENLLRVYGHIDLIGLSEIDALYESGKVVPLRPVEEAEAS